MKNIVICGYHGFSNSGDEALLWAMIESIRKKCSDVSITVLSIKPHSTKELYNVESVYRYNLLKINRLFKTTDLFLFGGGSLLQDVTSRRSLYYYLTILNLARKNQVRTMLYGNGIGPLIRKQSRKKTAVCLNNVDVITLRDEQSGNLLKEIGVSVPEIKVTADPAFTLEIESFLLNKKISSLENELKEKRYAVISIRAWKKTTTGFVEKLAKVCDQLNETYNIIPVFVMMQYEKDVEISKAVVSEMKTKGYVIDRAMTIEEIFAVIENASIVIGMRLHTLIYSTILKIPSVALSYDPKVEEFMKSIGQRNCVNVENMEKEEVLRKIDDIVYHMDEYCSELCATVNELKDRAEKNTEYVVKLLKKD